MDGQIKQWDEAAEAIIQEESPSPPEPPVRLYVPLPYVGICSTIDRPDLPQATYAHLEPIRAALTECEASINVGGINEGYDDVIVGKFQWEALVKSIKGENS